MSTTACARGHPSHSQEEQSGWWPSERTAKARLRAFFSRTKSENKIPKYQTTRDYDQACTQTLLPDDESSAAATHSGTRTRSTTWSSRNFRPSQRSLPQARPRTLTSHDPPPLAKAYSQATLHDFLDVPSSMSEVLMRNNHVRRSSISGESPTRSVSGNNVSSLRTTDESTGKHRRVWSGASSFTRKVFVLSNTGYILQYSADGHNDRVPEYIFELGPHSVAFVSDAIPGKHWVLRLSQDRARERGVSHSSKNSWTKLSFRHGENKRLVQELFMVFDNAMTLGIWLTVIRQEIEHLGGLEYRPDSREDDTAREAPSMLKAQKSLPNIRQSSLHIPDEPLFKDLPPSPKLLPPIPQWAPSRNVSRSTTDSSIHTLNDLDDIRGSSFSDDRSIYTATTSLAGSVASRSPAGESFSMASGAYREPLTPASTASRLSTPTQDDIGELSMYMATPRKSYTNEALVPKPLQSRAQSSGAQYPTPAGDMGVIDHALFVQPVPAYDHVNATSLDTLGVPMASRPISTVAPLPEPGHLRKASGRQRYEAQTTTIQPNTPASSRPSSIRSRSSSNVTLGSPTDINFKRSASYSLFPRRGSSMGQNSFASSADGSSHEGTASSPTSLTNEQKNGPAGRESWTSNGPIERRNSSKVLTVNTKLGEATVEQLIQPERSPTVTDQHLRSCFGAHQFVKKVPRAPSRSTLGSPIETTLLEISGNIPRTIGNVKLGNPPRKQRHVKGQKSMPSLVCGMMPPSGPPPTGPLPALPAGAVAHGKTKSLSKSSCTAPSSASSSTVNLQPRHVHAESSPSSLTATKTALGPAVVMPNESTHTKNASSVSSVDSVREVTAWLSSPKIAAFAAKYDINTPPRLEVMLPDTSTFSSSFGDLMPKLETLH